MSAVPTGHDLVADIRHVWPDFAEEQVSHVLLMLLGLDWQDRYGEWDIDRLHAELRAVGVRPRILRRRVSGLRRRVRLPGIRWKSLPGTPRGQRRKQ